MASFLLTSLLVALLSLFGVLLIAWILKATLTVDYIQSFTLVFISFILGTIFLICGSIFFVNSSFQDLQNTSFSQDLSRFIATLRRNCCRIITILFLIGVLAIFLWFTISPLAILILNYYGDSPKSIEINLSYETVVVPNNTPIILHLRQTAVKAENISVDLSYFNCRWTTNFGHFIEINSNNTEILTHQQEVFSSGLPKCPLIEDNVYWTYDISDFDKEKPEVLIGFTISDSNKGNVLGGNSLKFRWKDKDTIEFINKTNQS